MTDFPEGTRHHARTRRSFVREMDRQPDHTELCVSKNSILTFLYYPSIYRSF